MAVKNSITNRNQQMPDKAVEFQVNGAQVRLTPTMVRNYLTNGNGEVSDQEVAMFINLCRYQKLNPLIRDAYLIKYGSQPATIVTSKDAILKRAMRNPRYAGHVAGVIVLTQEGQLEHRTGAFTLPGETLIGGWARTYVKDYEVPIESAVSFEEYAGKKNDGSLNSMWASKPGVMIRKVALVTSMKEAFPEDLQGMYASEEVNVEIDEAMMTPVEIEVQPEANQPSGETGESKDPIADLQEGEPQQATMDDIDGVF